MTARPSADEIRARLSSLAAKPMIGGSVAALWDLKKMGVEPRVVYDVGACVGQWTKAAQTVWPGAKFVLFDAFEPAAFLWGDHERFVGPLSDEDGKIVKFFQNELLPTGNSYYKERNDDVFPEAGFQLRATRTLDSVVESYGFPPADLVKIDVQGCEADVIRGASRALDRATALVVEMQSVYYNRGAPLVSETKPKIEALGWRLVGKYDDNGIDADYAFVKNL